MTKDLTTIDEKLTATKEPAGELVTFLEDSGSQAMGIFSSPEAFTGAMQMATALSKSDMIPKQYQGNVPNTIIAMDVAMRLQMAPFAVMQNLYIVNGQPSWSSQFIIAVINKSRRFKNPLQFHLEGSGDSMSCYAWAIDQTGARIEGTKITMKMAKDEGWYGKTGSKWKTMPEQMLRYRAASFFGRAFCPDLIMGVYTEEEVRDAGPTIQATEYETVAPDPFSDEGKEDPGTSAQEPQLDLKAQAELEAPIEAKPKEDKKFKSLAQEELERSFLGE